MTASTIAYIGLGSNLGDRRNLINEALKKLAQTQGVELPAQSDIVETAPLGGLDQPPYLNAVAMLQTTLSAGQLLDRLFDIEKSLGRKKTPKWSSRPIDLDLLLFGNQLINTAELTVPHPQMHIRSFVLKALSQLNGTLVHPLLKESVAILADRLNGADFILDAAAVQLVSIAGNIGVGKTTLVKALAGMLDCPILHEPYDTNPYMPQVYAGKKELALDSQLYFLNHRNEQLSDTVLKAGRLCLSDYIFDKEPIYAALTLSTRQLSEYNKTYRKKISHLSKPVLVIYLTDTVENCLQRIHKRNRPYEQKIESAFLWSLVTAYEKLFTDWKSCPVIRIVMSEFDCTNDRDVEHLANQINYYTTD